MFVYILIALLFISPAITSAETHIKSGDLDYGATWTKDGSPYILDESVYVPNDVALSIEAGVSVFSASSTDPTHNPNTLTFDGSSLFINGNTDDPVNISGLGYIFLTHSYSDIKNTIFDNTGLNLWQSTSTITKTTIKNSIKAITTKGSKIDIQNSKLLNNTYGIASYKYVKGPVLVALNTFKDFNLVFEDSNTLTFDLSQNVININNSSIVGNTQYGVYNQTINPIDAANNWWGSVDGPRTGTTTSSGDRMYGLVNVTPWRESEDGSSNCCSNVLFLPGIESSRLYKDIRGIFGTSTNMLWEPNRNADIKKLHLDETGQSLDPSIYTSDILDSAYGLKSIYKSFIAMMDGVVADKKINQWMPFPYDWRMNAEDTVRGNTKLATTSVSLINTVKALAKNSKTGKVIIVAHSNGGLVAKKLMQVLEQGRESGIIERIINIAVPELGTPKAILSMLHGYDQSIAGGLIVTANNARALSQNMLSAYGLLPSRKLFESGPLTVVYDFFSDTAGKLVSNYESMKKFLINNSFSKKISSDINVPLLLSTTMTDLANSLHQAIDSWKPSTSTKVTSLLGWGLPTPEGIIYSRGMHCREDGEKDCDIKYSPIMTDDGDGTVITQSGSGIFDQILFLNLKSLKKDTGKDINHANILESAETLNAIKKQVANTNPDNDYGKYITSSKPIDTDKWLTINVYSPVNIDIYDKNGNHTGLKENYTPQVGVNPEETNIPLSFYKSYGNEDDTTKMVRLLYGEDYQIVLRGNSAGSVIIKADVSQFDRVIASTTFKEMPVTQLMNTELVLSTSTDTFATSSIMIMDVDGDGVTDFINRPNEYLGATTTYPIVDYVTYIESIRKVILALKLSIREEQKWLDRINRLVIKIDKKHPRKIEKLVKKLSKDKFKSSRLNDAQKAEVLEKFDEMLDDFESENQ